jgi:glycosyltransferase involved in cell wall biosynthesis
MHLKPKPRLLFLLRLPPRLTGATLMNSFVEESELLHREFSIRTIKLPHAKMHEVVGSYSLKKLIELLLSLIKLFSSLLFFRPRFVYFQISPLGTAFLRDLLFVCTIKLFRVKIVYHMHGKGIANACKNNWYKKLYRFAFRHEEVICLSNSLTSDLSPIYSGPFHIVPNVIKNELSFIPQRKPPSTLHILYISNLFVSKGIYVLIDSLEILKKKNISFNARIVGSEAEVKQSQLEEYIKIHNLSSTEIEYVGPRYNAEKWEEYIKADVLVFPTLNDIWGLVILEAMQAALPVIASIDGAIPEIIENTKTGFLVEKNNPEQIADRLEYLFHHPELSVEMGKTGQKRFHEKFVFEQFEQNIFHVFQTILA